MSLQVCYDDGSYAGLILGATLAHFGPTPPQPGQAPNLMPVAGPSGTATDSDCDSDDDSGGWTQGGPPSPTLAEIQQELRAKMRMQKQHGLGQRQQSNQQVQRPGDLPEPQQHQAGEQGKQQLHVHNQHTSQSPGAPASSVPHQDLNAPQSSDDEQGLTLAEIQKVIRSRKKHWQQQQQQQNPLLQAVPSAASYPALPAPQFVSQTSFSHSHSAPPTKAKATPLDTCISAEVSVSPSIPANIKREPDGVAESSSNKKICGSAGIDAADAGMSADAMHSPDTQQGAYLSGSLLHAAVGRSTDHGSKHQVSVWPRTPYIV